MNIRVHKCRNYDLRSEVLAAARFYASELLTRKMLPHIKIDIVFTSTIPDLGSCSVVYNNDWGKPREFEIELKRQRGRKTTLITLAHEMVHLKQFAKGELSDDHSKWMGKRINPDLIDYDDQPWEQEASLTEYTLYTLYKQHKAGLL